MSNAEGVNFSVPPKKRDSELIVQRMGNQRLFYLLLNWERPYRGDICTELNVERFELRKDATIGYFHPNGIHNDVFWALALACYSTVEMEPEPIFLGAILR